MLFNRVDLFHAGVECFKKQMSLFPGLRAAILRNRFANVSVFTYYPADLTDYSADVLEKGMIGGRLPPSRRPRPQRLLLPPCSARESLILRSCRAVTANGAYPACATHRVVANRRTGARAQGFAPPRLPAPLRSPHVLPGWESRRMAPADEPSSLIRVHRRSSACHSFFPFHPVASPQSPPSKSFLPLPFQPLPHAHPFPPTPSPLILKSQ